MNVELADLRALVAVSRAKGFREAARVTGSSASTLSEAVRRLEAELGVRLLHRTTRSVVPTEAGNRLLERVSPALAEVEDALDVVNGFREKPRGTLRLNVPLSAARLVLPALLPRFHAAYPEILIEIKEEESFVDIVAEGFDAGIRYGERLAQDVVAVPIGPRVQRIAAAASPAYLDANGRPQHPRDLLQHTCLRTRFPSGVLVPWQFERQEETVNIEPYGPLIVSAGGAIELAIDVALAGTGVIYHFEDWLAPHLKTGALEPILQDWWLSFPGPFLYYSAGKLLPASLRAFVDFVRTDQLPLV